MTLSTRLMAAIAGSSRERRIEGVLAAYAEVERAQAAFRAALGSPSCPSGCGTCCESFIPDVLPVEADLVAAWLLDRGRGLPKASEPPTACPFYDRDRPEAHCGIYPARPLICRLFAFTPTRDRDGSPIFALCKHMPSPFAEGARGLDAAALAERTGPGGPAMDDFAHLLIGLAPEEASQRDILPEALPRALAGFSLLLRLSDPDFPLAVPAEPDELEARMA